MTEKNIVEDCQNCGSGYSKLLFGIVKGLDFKGPKEQRNCCPKGGMVIKVKVSA